MNALTFPKSPAAATRAEQRATRRADLIASIPASVRRYEALFVYCERYIGVVAGLNSRQRARVILPWQRRVEPRPPHSQIGRWRRHRRITDPNRVLRGRSSNPTVLA